MAEDKSKIEYEPGMDVIEVEEILDPAFDTSYFSTLVDFTKDALKAKLGRELDVNLPNDAALILAEAQRNFTRASRDNLIAAEPTRVVPFDTGAEPAAGEPMEVEPGSGPETPTP